MRFIIVIILVFLLSFCSGPDDFIKAPGLVDGNVISVRALGSGTLDHFPVSEGSQVDKGATIGELNYDKINNGLAELEIAKREVENNHLIMKNQLKLLQARIDYLKKQEKRFERLKESKSIPGEQLEKISLQRLEAETGMGDLRRKMMGLDIQTERLENKMELLILTKKDMRMAAPVNGVILENYFSEGESVVAGSVIADVLDISSLYVDVFLEEREMTRLTIGSKAEIRIDGLEDKEFFGKVTFFGRKAEFSPKYIVSEKERQSLLYQVRVRPEGDLKYFKLGLPLTVIFDLKSVE